MRLTSKLAATLLAVLALTACAQEKAAPPPPPPQAATPAPPSPPAPPPTANLRGKIVKLDGQTLTVKTREGQTVNVALTADAGVRTMKKTKLADIKQGDYLSILTMPGKDGKQHAVEIHGLPARAPEAQFPYDYAQGSMMTNAHVQGIAKAKSGNVLTVTQKGTPSDVVIDNRTVIDTGVDGAKSDLRPGKSVFIRANKAADGSLSANNVTVEKNGVRPVM